MHNKPAQEFLNRQSHRFILIVFVIFIPKGYEMAVIVNDAAVFDRATSDIVWKILDYPITMSVSLRDVHMPILVEERMNQSVDFNRPAYLFCMLANQIKKTAAEIPRHILNCEQIVAAVVPNAFLIFTTGGKQAMYVRMQSQGSGPGM